MSNGSTGCRAAGAVVESRLTGCRMPELSGAWAAVCAVIAYPRRQETGRADTMNGQKATRSFSVRSVSCTLGTESASTGERVPGASAEVNGR